eukprot:TRINITY_DN13973_c1_g1_i5.p1 TRINITY_DN13973_c1_g1~~TRINITY_DN13973_c1_g1_i5.p1  ORF type:complete len:307 (+),score=35.98 TRINITY_DN13973_c1_g1_i5:39-959(+)
MKESVPFDPWTKWWYNSPYLTSLTAGGMAGLSVDLMLFPLDSIKTRRQAHGGMAKAGGIRNLYSGVQAAAIGSVPCSALFFVTYECSKKNIQEWNTTAPDWAVNATSAALGEIVASHIRVPMEIIKQRLQVGKVRNISEALSSMRRTGAFVGYKATLARDIPFSILQYPMYEKGKQWVAGSETLPAYEAALIGACTGSISAFITTPFDVCKTRVMLQASLSNHGPLTSLRCIYAQEGLRGLYKGCLTRSVWMGLGGLIFLGTYEQSKILLCGEEQNLEDRIWDLDDTEVPTINIKKKPREDKKWVL